ncbi:amidohydrolase family protein [Virgibacillus sp. W0430]|uniref:metal-dependent hydrolase family protein n=1 Tax=Virgibacillus sp. W0430 TaxID=3391580 RepID=UPI003F46EF1F
MRVIIKDCHLINGIDRDVIKDSYIVIEGDTITAIGQGTVETESGDKIIDAKGKYVMPGLIDAHVHLVWDGSPDPMPVIEHLENDAVTLRAYKHALDYLKLGITTVRDVGSPDRTVLHVRDAINSQLLKGPTIVSAGTSISITGGHVYSLGREADGVDGVRTAARTVLKEGADLLKLMATGGIYTEGEDPGNTQLTFDEIAVAVEEANNKNKRVAAHADGLEGIMNCIKAGVTTIEHGIYANTEALQLMKEKGMYLVPTMAVMRRLSTYDQIPAFAQEKALEVTGPHMDMLKKAVELGVNIATGTDCGSAGTPPEYYFEELCIMEEAGMKPIDVIKSSTSIAAACLGIDDRGIIAEGKKADLLLLNENPCTDLRVLKDEKIVLKNGEITNSSYNE